METYKLAILAARSFRSRPDYEDLLQEAAIRIWQAEPKIDPSRPEHERRPTSGRPASGPSWMCSEVRAEIGICRATRKTSRPS